MADNFYSKYSANEPATVVTTINGLNGAVTLAPGANITITPSGQTLTIASTSSGANTTLSNLTSPTAINQALLPSADNLINLGTAITNRFKAASFTDSASVGRYPFGAATPGAAIVNGAAPGLYVYNGGPDAYNVVADAGSGVSIENPGAGVSLLNVQNHLFTFKDSTTNTAYLSGSLTDIAASTGVTITTTTGALTLPRMTTTQRNALTPVNGMEIYNSTTDKFQSYENGAWVDVIGGSGANVTLSNLTNPTAVNQPLNASDGSASLDLTTRTISSVTNTVFDYANGVIYDSHTGDPVISTTGQHALVFASTTNAISWNNDINIKTEDQGVASSYNVTIKTGNATGAGSNTGEIDLITGNSDTGASGSQVMATGDVGGGGTSSAKSGGLTIRTGDDNGVGSTFGSGDYNLNTGSISDATASGATGSIGFVSGDNAGTGGSGSWTFTAGSVTSGTRGSFGVDAGSILATTTGDLDLQCSGAGVATLNGYTSTLVTCQNGDTTIESLSGNTVVSAKQLIFPSAAADPTGVAGGVYFNTGSMKLKVFNGTTWETITSV